MQQSNKPNRLFKALSCLFMIVVIASACNGSSTTPEQTKDSITADSLTAVPTDTLPPKDTSAAFGPEGTRTRTPN